MTQKITFHTSKIIKLNDFLRKELPLEVAKKIDLKDSQCEFSNSKIRRLILSGCIYVNNQKINRPAFELRGNSLITVYFDAEKFFYEKQTNDIDFVLTEKDILFEDQNLIFLNKPAFFPVEKQSWKTEKIFTKFWLIICGNVHQNLEIRLMWELCTG